VRAAFDAIPSSRVASAGRKRQNGGVSSHTHSIRDTRADRLVFSGEVENFDRVQFALHVLRRLAPPRMTVAVYECRRELKIERGRDMARGASATWGILGVPRSASREHIVLAIAELAGVSEQPFVVDLLMGSCKAPLVDAAE
jgi:hypothetical protein